MFHSFPPTDKLQVNHKNDNLHLCADTTNLEWVSAKENCEHADDTGLTTIQRAVNMRDINTNQVLQALWCCVYHDMLTTWYLVAGYSDFAYRTALMMWHWN